MENLNIMISRVTKSMRKIQFVTKIISIPLCILSLNLLIYGCGTISYQQSDENLPFIEYGRDFFYIHTPVTENLRQVSIDGVLIENFPKVKAFDPAFSTIEKKYLVFAKIPARMYEVCAELKGYHKSRACLFDRFDADHFYEIGGKLLGSNQWRFMIHDISDQVWQINPKYSLR